MRENTSKLKSDIIKMKQRTVQQIKDVKNRKKLDNDTHNRDLQQLYKDDKRLDEMIEYLK